MASGNAWTAARQEALRVRTRLLPRNADTTNAHLVLEAALRDAGLTVSQLPPDDALLSGAHAVLDREMDTVWIRDDFSVFTRRVLLAHELAHYYLHPDYILSDEYDGCDEEETDSEGGNYLVGYGPRQRRETEANVFAREFLLPSHIAHRLFYEEGLYAAEIAALVGVPVFLVEGQLQARSTVATVRVSDDAPVTGLDDSQRAAAHAEAGPLLVGAGPGTGKTRTLAARVLFLLKEKKVAPENILCLTFSRKAADEMRERIAVHTSPETARRLTVCTFHAFGLDLLRRYWKEAGLPPRPALLTMAEAFALLERRLPTLELTALHYLHDPTFPIPDVLRLIGRLKEEMIRPDEAITRAETLESDKLRDAARLYAAYEAVLRENGAMDFADLVCRAVALLEENATVRTREQSRWQHILVDEFQDVNRAGSRLVRALGGETGAGIWCVGDLRQAIYRFRGASPANVTRFTEEFPGGRRLDLAINYRSVPPLVALFGTTSGDGEEAWQAARPAALPDTAILATAPDDTAQIAGMVQEMRRLHEHEAVPFGNMAVLCRTNGQARTMRTAIAAQGIPVAEKSGDATWWKSRDVRELLLLLSLACEPEGLGKRVRSELPEPLEEITDPAEFFATALWGSLGKARSITDRQSVAALMAIANAFKEQSTLLTTEGENAGQAFLRHIRRLVRLGDGGLSRTDNDDTNEDATGVNVLTVHAAKGLEFPVVFLPNLSAGYFPPRAKPSLISDTEALTLLQGTDTADTNEEEARLFFVALSRARDRLILSRAEKYGRTSAKPSPLLNLLEDATQVALVEWEVSPPAPAGGALPHPHAGTRANASLDRVTCGALESRLSGYSAGRDSQTIATPEQLNNRSSVTLVPAHSAPPAGAGGGNNLTAHDAERYLRCPRRYYYETVRGFGDLRVRSVYDQFKKAIRVALDARDPAEYFAVSWKEHGPSASDPWHDLYYREATTIISRAGKREVGRGAAQKPLPHLFTFDGGEALTVEADASGGDSVIERFSFQKMPKEDRGSSEPERFNTLLCLASPVNVQVRVRYLRTGETLPVKPAPQSKKSHLAQYQSAIQGIQLQVFPAAPEDAGDCARCPYLFVCPDE